MGVYVILDFNTLKLVEFVNYIKFHIQFCLNWGHKCHDSRPTPSCDNGAYDYK